MNQGQIKQSSQTELPSSSQTRKEVLWNVQEPGDPYDIRKSMIAKLPGGKPFMGDELQIVCLFQAAEIQRLSDFLQTYKVKFKDLERVELDRHSYEIQIKELTQKIVDMDWLKKQNQKLKDFIKKQGNQLQTLQLNFRNNITNQEFNLAYSKALDRIKAITQANQELKALNDTLQTQINSFNAKLAAFEKTKSKQLEEISKKINQRTIESENGSDRHGSQHALNLFRVQVEAELRKLQREIRNLQEVNQTKNKEINQLRRENDSLQRKERAFGSRIELGVELQSVRRQYELKIDYLNAEIKSLDQKLKDSRHNEQQIVKKNVEYEQYFLQMELNIKDNQAKLRNRDEQITKLNDLIRRLNKESGKAGSQPEELTLHYQSEIKQLNHQIQLLSSKLRLQTDTSKQLKQYDLRNALQSESKVQQLFRQNEELRRGVLQNNELRRQLAHLQNSRAVTLQEIERLHEIINDKHSESNRLNILVTENQNLKRRLSQLQKQWLTRYESELFKLRNQFETAIAKYAQGQNKQHQSRVLMLQRQLQRYRDILSLKNNEQSKHKQLEYQQQQKLKNFQLLITTLQRENQQLFNKNRHLNELEIKFTDSINRIRQLERDNQQIRERLRLQEEENSHLRQRVIDTEEIYKRKSDDLNRKINELTQNRVFLQSQNEDLKKKVYELIANSNNISKETVNELTRLNSDIRALQEDNNILQNANRKLTQQNQTHKQTTLTLTRQKQDLRRLIAEIEGNSQSKINQSSSSFRMLQQENNNLRRQNNTLNIKAGNLQAELRQKGSTFSHNYELGKRENEELRRGNDELKIKIRERDARIANLQTEIEIVSRRQKQKVQQLASMQQNYRNATIETENLRRYFKDYESTGTRKYQGQASQKYSNDQQNLQNMSRQLEEQKRRYNDLDSNHRHIVGQYQSLRRQMSQRDTMINKFQADVTTAIAHYENTINVLTRNNEDLQRKLNETERLLRLKDEDLHRSDSNYRNALNELDISKRKYNELEVRSNQKIQGEVFNLYKNYERNIVQLSSENELLKQKVAETTDQLNRKIIEINNLSPLLSQVEILKRKLLNYDVSISQYEGDVGKQFALFQQNMQGLAKENEELKRKIQEETNKIRHINMQSGDRVSQLNKEVERMNINMTLIEKENYQLKRRIADLNDLARAVAQLQSKLAITSQELERTNANLRAKCNEHDKLQLKNRNLNLELENSKKQQLQLQSRYNQTYRNEVVRKYNAYQQTIVELKRHITQVQAVNQELYKEIEKYGLNLKDKGEESHLFFDNYQKLIQEHEELKRKIREAEGISNQRIIKLQQENQEYRRRFMEYDAGIRQIGTEVERKTSDYENKIRLLKEQIQRSNLSIREYEQFINQKGEIEIKSKFTYENTINGLSRQNEDLRKKIQQLSDFNKRFPEYQHKISNVIQQNDKLQQALRSKADQLGNSEAKLRHATQEIEQLKREITQLERSLTNKYLYEVSAKVNSYEQSMALLHRQREELHGKKIDYQGKIVTLTHEIERLNQLVRARSQQLQRAIIDAEHFKQISQKRIISNQNQLNKMQSNFQKISKENQTQRRYLQQYELNTRKLHGQFERLQTIIDQLKKQRQTLFEKNHILSSQIERLSRQNQDLQIETRDMRLQLSNQSSLQKRVSEHLALMVVLFAQIQTLRKRVSDKQQEVEQVRRSSLSPHILKY